MRLYYFGSRLTTKMGLAVLLLLFLPSLVLAGSSEQTDHRLILHARWTLQSSCKISATGEEISAPGFSTKGWHSVTVPSTVVAALVADKTFPDPDFGENLRSIPGTTYPIGKNFSLLPMADDSPFHCSWWYRTEFRLPVGYKGRHVWLHFGGINNHANIWLNGHQIAGAADVGGAYRTYEFDVTSPIVQRRKNVLAVETFAQTPDDLGINWVDWNPAPADKEMGLWRGVYLQSSGPVAVRFPMVTTHFPSASLDRADLTVEAELHNATKDQASGYLEGNIGDVHFRQDITLKPSEIRTVIFTPTQFPQLQIKGPKLWWPRQMGPQNLHELSLRFVVGKDLSDEQTVRFGIREITSTLDDQGHRLFRVNGKRILIRGGGWSPDMLLREPDEHLETQFRYVRSMNLNTIRLEGKMESDEFYNLADEQGVLIMAGWCCCDYWEEWDKWKPGTLEIATASLHSQIMRMRSHPSMLVWLNGSDNPPPPDVEEAYIQVLKDSDWPNPYISSASQKPTTVTGPSGVKMTGPYDYVPPDYWLNDTAAASFGGAYGFNTETSPGPAVPPVSSLRKFLPPDHIKVDDPVWNYHAGSEGFKDLSHFDGAMDAIYGTPSGLGQYEVEAQAMAYDGERAMFEAYSGKKYATTGVIQWMLDNAWPSLIWHLYDYYLQPAGGYFGTKKACEPLHVQYSYDDRSIKVVNSEYKSFSRLTVRATLYDLHLHVRFQRQAKTDVDSDGVATVMTLPEDAFNPVSPVYFVNLTLENGAGRIVSRNFYWLSSKKNTYDWLETTYRYTPVSSYEDLTALQTLPKVPLDISASIEHGTKGPMVRVKLRNPGRNLAFQVRLGVRRKSGSMEILPVFWDDNYIELMPGETREIVAQYASFHALAGNPELTVSGWNIEPVSISLGAAGKETADSHASKP